MISFCGNSVHCIAVCSNEDEAIKVVKLLEGKLGIRKGVSIFSYHNNIGSDFRVVSTQERCIDARLVLAAHLETKDDS